MNKRLNETKKLELIRRYESGMPIALLNAETGIPRSTLYSWVQQYQTTTPTKNGIINLKGFNSLRRKSERLEDMVSILKTANCTASSDLQDKLYEMEKLYEQFNIHVVCDAFDVPLSRARKWR
jgi:transposase-like protein